MEAEHVLEHRPFLGRKIRILDRFGEGVFKVMAKQIAGFETETDQNSVIPMVAQAFGLRERPERAVVATSIFIHKL